MRESEGTSFGELAVSDCTEVETPLFEAGEDAPADDAAGPADAAAQTAARAEASHHAHDVARRAWYGLLTQAVDKILPVIILLYLARVLDPASFGIYAFVIAYLAFFQIVSDYSIDTVLVRTMSQDPAERDALLYAGLGLKLTMALCSVCISVAFVGIASNHQTPPSLMLVAAFNLPTALGGAYRAWHRARLEIFALFWQAALRAVLLAIGVWIAVLNGSSLTSIFLAMSGANLLTFFIIAFVLRKKIAPRIRFDLRRWRRLAGGVIPLMLNAFAMTVSLRIGQILLMTLRGPVEVGQLGAASRVTEAFSLLPEALMISIYPLMAGLHARESPALLTTAERSVRYLVVATGIPVVLCAVQSGLIMSKLFGPSFVEAGVILSLLAFTALFSATGTVILNLLVATHNEKAMSRNTLVFAGVGATLSWLAISTFGTIGAAVAALATTAASQVSLAMLPSTRRYVRATLASAARPLAAVLLTVLATRLTGLEGVASMAASMGIYVIFVAAFGIFGAAERRLLRSLLEARGIRVGN
ncbi:MAG TPA: flippase [Candidatus Binatia bacterium]|jgi:O-antigen/teichoic acid export membrane protein